MSLQLNGQDLRYGKVGNVDFTLKAKDVEEVPDAIVILKKEHVDFDINKEVGLLQRRTIHERIKINTEAGLEYATRKVLLYMDDGRVSEKIKSLKAVTYNLIDGELNKKKLKKSAVFKEVINDQLRIESFTMPDVKIGSVIEFTYVVVSPYVVIDDVILQYGVPILNIDVKMVWLELYQYKMHFNPRATYVPIFDFEDSEKNFSMISRPNSIYSSNGTYKSVDLDRYKLDSKIISLKDSNIPALNIEPMAGNMNNYRSKVIVELTGKKIADYDYKQYSTTWEDVSNNILNNDKFGDQIDPSRFFKKDLESLIKDLKTDKEKIKAILQFVKEKVKWDGGYGKYADNGVKKAFKVGSGNVADINLLLIAMLREAKLNTFPVLVSTKNNGIPFYPTIDGFNYVIASVIVGGETYLLDATEKHTGLNMLPLRVMNWQGRLIEKEGQSEWIDLFPSKNSKEFILIDGEFNKDGEVDISVKKRLTDYRALNIRDKYANSNMSAMQTLLESGDSGIDISNIATENMDMEDVPLSIYYDGIVSNAIEEIGEKLFITPLLHEANRENPFKLKHRKFPLDLGYPLSTKVIVNLKIPEGYVVESIPESVKLSYEDGLGSYTYKVNEINAMISTVVDLKLDTYLIEPEDYETFKSFFEAIVAKDAEKIVLKKI
ncbi:hypothetical protein BST94_15490 [Nonlabens xylanidelens]|nr:hypothetical protein BST94_15490 [Nonlabens xylanidelens]